MRLAIADPPYLGTAEMFYGEREVANMNRGGNINGPVYKADHHPEARYWDTPEAHQALVETLVDKYDGWAIAMVPRNLRQYLKWVPQETRIAVWHDPKVMPTGSHPRRRWEAVLVYVPEGRRRVVDVPNAVGDVHTSVHSHKYFAGAKPRSWTRWVLDMLGYSEDEDSVDDLFGGSGAVANEIAQLTLALPAKATDGGAA